MSQIPEIPSSARFKVSFIAYFILLIRLIVYCLFVLIRFVNVPNIFILSRAMSVLPPVYNASLSQSLTKSQYLCPMGQCWYCTQCSGCCPCAAGSYCPGDDRQYACQAGYYSAVVASMTVSDCTVYPSPAPQRVPTPSRCFRGLSDGLITPVMVALPRQR
jgi:hypothetical protein